MRSRRSGLGRLSGDTKASGRRVTCKAPLAHVEWGSGRSEASPTAVPQDTHSVEGRFSEDGRALALFSTQGRSPVACHGDRVHTASAYKLFHYVCWAYNRGEALELRP